MRIFICYAHTDADLALVEALVVRLKVLKRLMPDLGIEFFWDRDLTAGTDWKLKLPAELESADVVLLMLSDYALASDYIWDVELPIALRRQAAGKAIVIPIIGRPCAWAQIPFLQTLQPLPGFKETIIAPGVDAEVMWDKVRDGIRDRILQHLAQRETKPPEKTPPPERPPENPLPPPEDRLRCRAHLQWRDAAGLWERVGQGLALPAGSQLRVTQWPGTAPHALILVERRHPQQGWIEIQHWHVANPRPSAPGWRAFPPGDQALAEAFPKATTAWRVHLWLGRESPQELLDLLGRAPGSISPDGTLPRDRLDTYRRWHADLQALLSRASRDCTREEIPPPAEDQEFLGLPASVRVAEHSASSTLLISWEVQFR